jgi:murein DD-endopeptidase MepM/ murein hydrolase activator NlpD
LRKRFYILFVARGDDGELRKIHIPLHYMYVFLVGAVAGMLTITGMAGSYTRMLMKISHFNQLRTEKQQLQDRYVKLEEVAQEKELQVASLSSLANEVSALYGLKSDQMLNSAIETDYFTQQQLTTSLEQLEQLKTSALNGSARVGVSVGDHDLTTADWLQMAAAPIVWPVVGKITGPFGERIDPFNGEGAFHRGVDISCSYGDPIVAPADGVVTYSEFMSGYGRTIEIDHGHGVSTRYGHLSAFAVVDGQKVQRGTVIGYVGMSGRSTGPHLHYEVWVHGTPVNPAKYLRTTAIHLAQASRGGAGAD